RGAHFMHQRLLIAVALACGLAMAAPASSDEQGRWKLDGTGTCYFDPLDSGPDQCIPDDPGPNEPDQPGRWKDDGLGGCVFVAGELAPGQGVPEDGGEPNENEDEPGGWKLDGAGNCYFDENDDGPDQCEPSALN